MSTNDSSGQKSKAKLRSNSQNQKGVGLKSIRFINRFDCGITLTKKFRKQIVGKFFYKVFHKTQVQYFTIFFIYAFNRQMMFLLDKILIIWCRLS
jgi:hypothetical protein